MNVVAIPQLTTTQMQFHEKTGRPLCSNCGKQMGQIVRAGNPKFICLDRGEEHGIWEYQPS